MKDLRGSGSDKNSDSRRLQNPENYQDKVEEDTFPASDAPSTSPMTGMGPGKTYGNANDFSGHKTSHENTSETARKTSRETSNDLPENFKEDPNQPARSDAKTRESDGFESQQEDDPSGTQREF